MLSFGSWDRHGRWPRSLAAGVMRLAGERRDVDGVSHGFEKSTQAVPHNRPSHDQEVFATLHHRLRLDVGNATISDQTGRPQ